MSEIRQKTVNGLLWTFAESFSLQIFGFVQGVILARLLMPSDYGLIAMTGIFFAISYTLIDSGFTNALVRKNSREPIDYSTVYVTNVTLSLFFSILLAFSSTWIARFYDQPLLRDIVCVNAVYMFLQSFIAVQGTKLSIELNFKLKSIIHVTSTIVIGVVSIILAFMGFGVWSLIYPNFLGLLVRGLMYWRFQHWFPGLNFSWKSFKEFFAYGSKIMLSGLLDTAYNNLAPLIIGKKFSSSDLGYYDKARSYASIPSTTASNMLSKVTFPVLAKVQDDKYLLASVYRKMIRLSGFVVFPIMMLLAALAKPFVLLLITEKWAPAIPLLQVICFSMMWYPIHALNLNLLMVRGRSDLFLRLEIIKKIIGLSILFTAIRYGVFWLCIGNIAGSLICLIVNTFYTGKLIGVGYLTQMKDLTPSLLSSIFMGSIVFLLSIHFSSYLLQLVSGTILGILIYIGLSYVFNNRDMSYSLSIFKENILKK
ncbi:MAG: lipopolysaccharide biosynthesis protein [Prevotella sp.]|nr:lipopolysaccharide biosynthesis protein [Prevotella sp.]